MVQPRLIYVIDADPAEARRIARCLGGPSRLIRVFDDPEEALAAVAAIRPALVVCDQDLPGRAGIDVLAEVRRIGPGIPTLLCLAGEPTWRVRRARRKGIFDALATRPADGLFALMVGHLLGEPAEAAA